MGRRCRQDRFTAHAAQRGGCDAALGPRRGFSLVELIIVLFVTMILVSMLMPAMRGLQDHAERMISQSNQRQIGMGLSMFATDHQGLLPHSRLLRTTHRGVMQEMMALYVVPDSRLRARGYEGDVVDFSGWDGLGHLYHERYLNAPDVFYCPSHRGDHHVERYRRLFDRPDDWIYGNYHYRGDIDVYNNNVRITLERDAARIIVIDGLRTKRDLNHEIGYNSLYGDGAVVWKFDNEGRLYNLLPDRPLEGGEADRRYRIIWREIDKN